MYVCNHKYVCRLTFLVCVCVCVYILCFFQVRCEKIIVVVNKWSLTTILVTALQANVV